jgi:hypothetical protein
MCVGVCIHAFMHALCVNMHAYMYVWAYVYVCAYVYVYCTCACIFIDTDTQIGTHLLRDFSCNDIAVLKVWLSVQDLFRLVDSLQRKIFSTLSAKNIRVHFYIHIKSSKKVSFGCMRFTEWLSKSPDLNPLHYHVWHKLKNVVYKNQKEQHHLLELQQQRLENHRKCIQNSFLTI